MTLHSPRIGRATLLDERFGRREANEEEGREVRHYHYANWEVYEGLEEMLT